MGYETATTSVAMTTIGRVAAGLAATANQWVLQQSRELVRPGWAAAARSTAGLRLGTRLPDLELPDLAGRRVRLSSFRNRRILLVHWSGRCASCDLIAQDLAVIAPDLAARGTHLLLVSSESAEVEREAAAKHGIEGLILLQGRRRIRAFARLGTPSAYFLDEQRRVAWPLVAGADQVLALAEQLAPTQRPAASLPMAERMAS